MDENLVGPIQPLVPRLGSAGEPPDMAARFGVTRHMGRNRRMGIFTEDERQ
jgi:hypothetical protein